LLLLIFGIVGTLTSLNVIMLPSSLDWRAFSLGNNNNSSTLNEDTNNEGGGEEDNRRVGSTWERMVIESEDKLRI